MHGADHSTRIKWTQEGTYSFRGELSEHLDFLILILSTRVELQVPADLNPDGDETLHLTFVNVGAAKSEAERFAAGFKGEQPVAQRRYNMKVVK